MCHSAASEPRWVDVVRIADPEAKGGERVTSATTHGRGRHCMKPLDQFGGLDVALRAFD